MTDAEKAYALAEKLIEQARETGAEDLIFDREDLRALDRLPPEIGKLRSLNTLFLDNTQISDLSPLAGLIGLTGLLYLDQTSVTDLSPLAGLTGLTGLSLDQTSVTDLSPLAGLTELTGLSLDQTSVTDLSPLAGLTGLTGLSLDQTSVTDLSPLAGLTGLERLYLSQTSVTDLSPLAGLTGLERLYLNQTSVTDLSPLAGLTGLGWLYFLGCAATQADERMREISEFEGNEERIRALRAYLAELELRVEPDELPRQVTSGFQFNITDAGQLGFAAFPMSPEDDPQNKDLHDLLREEVALLLVACPDESQSPYSEFRTLVERYETALGADLDALVAPILWNAGNKLRNEARSDALRSGTVLDEKPKLTEGLRDGLDTVLALHNAFVSGHAVLSKLDATREDPVDRHAAALDPDQMQAFVDALDGQTRLIVETVIVELRDLHSQAAGTDAAAARALGVERDSLENLINRAVREALIQQKGGTLAEVSGHVTGAAVGAVTTGAAMALGPEVATSYPQLVQALQPHINTLLSMWHGADYPVRRAVDYLDSKQRLE